jgi:TP901 family phage tail tape measure protein
VTVRSVAVQLTANVGSYVNSMRTAAAQTTAVGTAAEQASARAAAAMQAQQRAQLAALTAQNRAAAQQAAQQNRVALAQRQADAAARSGNAAQQAAAQANLRAQQQAMQQLQARTRAEQAAQRTAVNNAREQAQLARQQQQATQQLLLQQQQAHASMQATGVAIGVASVALLAFGAAGVEKAAEFEQAMSHVQAATHASAVEMGALRDAAIAAGARTVFTATESANAIEEMAKAGVSTRDILNGGLNGALDLAAAGTLGVADAAEMASSAMVQFGLKGDQVSHVADLMSAAANKAQGTVQDVSTALSYVGPVAAQAGMSIESTVGAIAELQNNGIMAEKAGTGLRGMLLSLQSPSVKAAAEMQSLGISVYDAQGKMLGWGGIAQVLQDRLGNLSEAQRNYALGVIFSNAQLPAAISLMKGGAAAADGWAKGVDQQGYAAETARIKLDNLRGDVEKLHGALDTAFISGGSGGLAPLRKLTEGATGLVNAYNSLDASTQGVVSGAALVAGALGLASASLLIFTPRVIAARASLQGLGTTAPRAAAAIKGLGMAAGGVTAITALSVGLGELAAHLERSAPSVDAMTAALLRLNGGGTKALDDLFQTSDGIKGFANSIDMLADPGKLRSVDNTLARVFTFGHVGNQGMDEAKRQVQSLDEALASLVQDGHAKQAQASFEALARQAAGQGVSVGKLRQQLPQYADALKGVDNQSKLTAGSTSSLKSAVEAETAAMDQGKDVANDLKDALDSLLGVALDADQADAAFEASLDDMTKALERGAKAAKGHTMSISLNTKAGRDNRAAYRDAVSALIAKVEADAKAGASSRTLQKELKDGSTELRKQAHDAGLTNDQIHTLNKTYGLTPKAVDTIVMANAALNRGVNQGQGGTKGQTFRAQGGYIAGPGGPTDDQIPAMLSNGEYVVRASAVRALGVDTLDELNRYATGGLVQQRRRFATGGVVSRNVDVGVGDAPFDSNRLDAAYANATATITQRATAQVVAQLRTLLNGALAFARGEVGKPYVWGGVGPGGYDCSGFMSAIANVVTGSPVHRRRMATATFADGRGHAGFVPGYGSPGGFTIGVMQGNPGHMAGTLAGVNVESRGGQGVVVGPSARGASNSLFRQRFHLQGYRDGGLVRGYASGGRVGRMPAMPKASASVAQIDASIAALDAYNKRWQAANDAADAHAERLRHVRDLNHANAEIAKAEREVSRAAKTKSKDDDRQAQSDLRQARADRAQAAKDLRDYDAQAKRDATQRTLDARAARLQQQRDAAAAREQKQRDAAAARAQAAAEKQQQINDRTAALTQGDLTQRQLVQPAPSMQAVLLNAQDAVDQLMEWDRDLVALRKRGLSQTSINTLGLEDGPQMLGMVRQLMRATAEQIKQLNQLTWTRAADARQVASGKHLAAGGYVTGPGSGTSDSVPAMLSNGEFVVRAAATRRYRAQLEHMNRYADGGIVRAGSIAPPPVSVNVAGTDTWQLQVEMRRTRQAIERQTATLSQQTAVVAVGV